MQAWTVHDRACPMSTGVREAACWKRVPAKVVWQQVMVTDAVQRRTTRDRSLATPTPAAVW